MIRISSVTKNYDNQRALDNLNMNIPKGSIYGLIGANGAGKTTVIRHIAGVLAPDFGDIEIEGDPIWENKLVKDRMGIIPDSLYFPNAYSLTDMAKLYSRMYSSWNEDRFHEMTRIFKLDEHRKIRTFSKGMKKQCAFSLVMATMPDYLLLDEPIDGLDPIVRKIVWKYIVDDVADREMTVLVSSHNLKEMEGICDYIGIMSKGRMLIERDLDSLKGDLHKIQLSYGKDRSSEDMLAGLDIVHHESRGTVDLLVVRGITDEITNTIEKTNPIIFDMLPLTLEEVFIYELGGEDDEINKLIF